MKKEWEKFNNLGEPNFWLSKNNTNSGAINLEVPKRFGNILFILQVHGTSFINLQLNNDDEILANIGFCDECTKIKLQKNHALE